MGSKVEAREIDPFGDESPEEGRQGGGVDDQDGQTARRQTAGQRRERRGWDHRAALLLVEVLSLLLL